MSKEATRIQAGAVVDYTASGTIANGDIIPLADRVGVALNDAVSGDVISLELEGVFNIAAKTADAITFGALVYFDATNREVTTTSTDNTKAGIAITTKAGATAGSVDVKIG
jgi:predicted RecA/RadA family phage recombinase